MVFQKDRGLILVVNILTNLGVNTGQITVFGGKQLRPNIHINDMIDAYINVLEQEEKVNSKIYNVGYENQPVLELANLVKKNIEKLR